MRNLCCPFFKLIGVLFIFFSCISCDEDAKFDNNSIETSTVLDAEGNEYKTVKIGKQWWMAENLRSKKFQSGVIIQEIKGKEEWSKTIEPAFYQLDSDAKKFGLLYNYFTIEANEIIAPQGWRIPTDEDWKILERHLEMSHEEINSVNWRGDNQGNQLKIEAEKGLWTIYAGNWPDNKYGFSAVGSSCRFYDGNDGEPGLNGSSFFWSSTRQNNNEAWFRYLDYQKSGIFRYFGDKNYGFSIRCVKDN